MYRKCVASRSTKYAPSSAVVAGSAPSSSFAKKESGCAVSVEREVFLHELWLPSHHNYTSVGAVLRVMNYLCFANSKVAFRQLRHNPKITPVVVQLNYHSDFAPRMEALYTHYVERSGSSKLKDLPLADEAGAASAVRCDPASSRDSATPAGGERGCPRGKRAPGQRPRNGEPCGSASCVARPSPGS